MLNDLLKGNKGLLLFSIEPLTYHFCFRDQLMEKILCPHYKIKCNGNNLSLPIFKTQLNKFRRAN